MNDLLWMAVYAAEQVDGIWQGDEHCLLVLFVPTAFGPIIEIRECS